MLITIGQNSPLVCNGRIENSLIRECDWDDWKDAIKNDHTNATENELDEL